MPSLQPAMAHPAPQQLPQQDAPVLAAISQKLLSHPAKETGTRLTPSLLEEKLVPNDVLSLLQGHGPSTLQLGPSTS